MSVATSTTNGHREVGKPRLKRSMGLWMATALVVGNMVGSGIFTLPAVLAGEAGPASILALVFTGIGAMLLALVFANLGRAHPHTGGPVLLRPARVRRLRRLPDGLGLLDRRLGRQRRDRRRLRRLPRRLLGRRQHDQLAGGTRRDRRDLAVHAREHPRRPRDGCGPGADDGAEVRAARRHRPHRPLLHQGRQLHAVHAGRRRLRLAHQRRSDAGALGLHRARVGDGAGRGGQGPREDDSSGDDSRHARDDAAVPGGADRDRRRPVAGRARRLVGALCRRGERDLGRNVPGPELGQVDRPGRHGGDPRRSERLDHADRPRLDGGGGRRSLPASRSPACTASGERRSSGSSSPPSSSADWCSTTGTPASRIASRTSSCWRPG